MESYEVTLSDIYYSVSNNNLIIPGGTQDTGKGSFNIKVPSIIESAQDVYSIPIKVTQDAIVTLGDIADIKRTFKDFTSYARINGQDAVTLEVQLSGSTDNMEYVFGYYTLEDDAYTANPQSCPSDAPSRMLSRTTQTHRSR